MVGLLGENAEAMLGIELSGIPLRVDRLAYTTMGNLWLPIALDFGWNYLQGPILGLTVSGQSLDSGWQLVKLQGPSNQRSTHGSHYQPTPVV